MRKTVLLLVPVLLLGACTYGIKPDPGSKNVRTAWNGDVSGCRELGKVTVSVADHIGPVDRNNITVRDELQVMARNEALTMNADTIKPLAELVDGSQAWGAYQCGANGAARSSSPGPARPVSPPPAEQGNAQTYPVK